MIVAAAIITLCLVCLISFWISVTALRTSWKLDNDLEILKDAISNYTDSSQKTLNEIVHDIDDLYKKINPTKKKLITSSKKGGKIV